MPWRSAPAGGRRARPPVGGAATRGVARAGPRNISSGAPGHWRGTRPRTRLRAPPGSRRARTCDSDVERRESAGGAPAQPQRPAASGSGCALKIPAALTAAWGDRGHSQGVGVAAGAGEARAGRGVKARRGEPGPGGNGAWASEGGANGAELGSGEGGVRPGGT